MDRRKFIVGAAAALAVGAASESAEAAEAKFQYLPSNMTEKELEAQKIAAVESLKKSIPSDPKVAYLRTYAEHLSGESQMYIPSPNELKDVVQKSSTALGELSAQIQENGFGILVFAETNKRKSEQMQRLYVLQRKTGTDVQFIKGYRVSTSEHGFGNDKNSGKTPLGLHTIQSGRRGLFGEVVSGLNRHRDMFNHISYKGAEHWFVKYFGEKPAGERSSDVAEVVTDQYLLTGPATDASRGIRIHGTNRSGTLKSDGSWKSFLGGVRRSSGCIRMSNVDVRDLSLSGYIKSSEQESIGEISGIHTPVLVFATDTAQSSVHIPNEEWSGPPRWTPPDEATSDVPVDVPAQPKQEIKEIQKLKTGPKRWVPPEE